MAATSAAIIETRDQTEEEQQLQFQDFGINYGHDSGKLRTTEQTHQFTDFPDVLVSDDETEPTEQVDLLSNQVNKASSFFSFAYYQKYFDVETKQVLTRILWSMIPKPKANYLDSHIRPNPDLYGPFWICMTLVFAVAIGGNFANYLMNADREDYHTKYDFHKVSIAATVVFTYASIVPLGLWLTLWYRKIDSNYTLLEILCYYGYSLAIYIPVSILWTIPLEGLRWFLVCAGSALSGGVLLIATWPAFQNETKKISVFVMSLQFALHLLLAVGFVMYFFRSSHDTSNLIVTTVPNVTSESSTTVVTTAHTNVSVA